MYIEAALISFELEGNKRTYETSGVLLDRNTVLITGTCFIPLMEQKEWIFSLIKTSSSELDSNECLNKVFFHVFFELEKSSENEKVSKNICNLESQVVGVWKCPFVSESVEKLFFRDWTFGHVNFDDESQVLSSDDIEMSKELMSIFILLKCKGRGELERIKENNISNDHIRVLPNLMLSLQKPRRGQEIEIVSTPFGKEYFMNSLSCGIISNVVGSEKCIILTDARSVSGCEGGPIFVAGKSWKEEKPKLLGIVTCPLTWWRGEWIGLTIGVSLMPVLERLLKIQSIADFPKPVEDITTIFSSDLLLVNLVDDTLVLIRSKTSWGSGVILSAVFGVIITCSHVVKGDKTVSVFQKGNQYTADVVFKSSKNLAYDLAILKTRDNFLFTKTANFSINIAKIGEPVIAAGFPFFSERDNVSIRPSIVTGCVAQANPYMIQTTCCIQSGFSGGGLFRHGELLGIIISNAKNSTVGASFPHINFVVPSLVFREPVLKYIKTNDVNTLRSLECSDFKVQALWKLQGSKL